MTVNRMVYIPEDKSLQVDGETIFDVNIEWFPINIHALQWYGDEHGGEIEYKSLGGPFESRPPNERIQTLGEFESLIDIFFEEKQRRIDAEIAVQEAVEASRNYWQEMRQIRDHLLSQSDWSQLSDVPLTQEEKDLWLIYRQQLRDLPENITDPKPMVIAYNNGEIHPDWPISPQ